VGLSDWLHCKLPFSI